MAGKAIKKYRELIGKRVEVFFTDSANPDSFHSSYREATLIDCDRTFTTIKHDNGLTEMIFTKRVIRIKEVK